MMLSLSIYRPIRKSFFCLHKEQKGRAILFAFSSYAPVQRAVAPPLPRRYPNMRRSGGATWIIPLLLESYQRSIGQFTDLSGAEIVVLPSF